VRALLRIDMTTMPPRRLSHISGIAHAATVLVQAPSQGSEAGWQPWGSFGRRKGLSIRPNNTKTFVDVRKDKRVMSVCRTEI
jgi:hypothetical protein